MTENKDLVRYSFVKMLIIVSNGYLYSFLILIRVNPSAVFHAEIESRELKTPKKLILQLIPPKSSAWLNDTINQIILLPHCYF